MRISLVVVSAALLAPAMAIVAVSAAGRECSLGCCRGCRSHLHLGQDLVTASTTAVVVSGAGGVAALPILVATVAGLIVLVGTVVAILIAIDLTARFVVELGPLALVILALLPLESQRAVLNEEPCGEIRSEEHTSELQSLAYLV